MPASFNHENLDVYRKCLVAHQSLASDSRGWSMRHAVTDQLRRAAESMVENLAEACGAFAIGNKQAAMDCSLGSVLECSACVDVANIKKLFGVQASMDHKKRLAEIFRMLFGLRKSWGRNIAKDVGADYRIASEALPAYLFHHESLQVYQRSLALVRALAEDEKVGSLPLRQFRKVDSLATSITLNLAEGNGRFSHADHARFIEIAHRSGIRLAAQLDILVAQGVVTNNLADNSKEMLMEICRMTGSQIGYLNR